MAHCWRCGQNISDELVLQKARNAKLKRAKTMKEREEKGLQSYGRKRTIDYNLVYDLRDNHGLKTSEIAEKLSISKSLVSNVLAYRKYHGIK